MPRYYFDLVDDKTVYDKKGVSLPNTAEAQAYAETFARELMETKSTLLGEDWEAWSVRVSNGKFQQILSIPFTAVTDEAATPTPDARLKTAEESGEL